MPFTNSNSTSNISNTADIDKPISTATQTGLNLKANQSSISNIDNISDLNKPISTATQTGLNLKLQTVTSLAALQSYLSSNTAFFDGSEWTKKTGNISSNGGGFAGTIINVNSTNYWERKLVFETATPEMFGAVGDAITDDTQALQRAIDYIVTNQKELSLSKTYLTNIVQSDKTVLYINYTVGKTWKITGTANATILCTTNSEAQMLWVRGDNPNSIIKDVYFKREHTLLPNYQTGIMFGGFGGIKVKNLIIDNCIFSGFQQANVLNGTDNLVIQNSKFLSLKGHDDGTSDSKPNVSIWSINNANGVNINTNVINNLFDGYASTVSIASTISKRPLDGFIFGAYNGLKATGNIINNFAEEAILVEDGLLGGQILISDNKIDGTLPLGSESGGLTKNFNYHIRVESSNSIISNNTLTETTWGIFSRGVDAPSKLYKNISIVNNIIKATTQNFKIFLTGISINGDAINKTENVLIANNQIYVGASYLNSNRNTIEIIRAKKVSVIGNVLIEENTIKNGFTITGLYCELVDNLSESLNKITGFNTQKNILLNNTLIGNDIGNVTAGTIAGASIAELGRLIGVISPIQSQIDAKPNASNVAGLNTSNSFTPTLTATGNNNILRAISINPTFQNFSFTNPINTALSLNGSLVMGGSNGLSSSIFVSKTLTPVISTDYGRILLANFFTGDFELGDFALNSKYTANSIRNFFGGNSGSEFSVFGNGSIKRFAINEFGNSIFQGGGTYTDIPSAIVQINSTTKGVLFPRMTTVQRDLINLPATGLEIYNLTTNQKEVYNGSIWSSLNTNYLAQSVAPTTPTSGFSLFANSSNVFSWKGTNGFVRNFDGTANTADRSYVLPNASGTVSLLESNQTFTGINSFTGANLMVGTTTNAGFRLDVNGTSRFSGDMTLLGNITMPFDNSFFAIGNNSDIGFTKKNGFPGMLTYSSPTFTIGKSSGSTIVPSNTFTNFLTIIDTGTLTVLGSLIAGGDNKFIGGLASNFFGIVKKNGEPEPVIALGATSPIRLGHWSTNIITDNTITSGTFNEKLRILPNGNVVIGTTSDAGFKLDVNGTARVNGTLTTSTNITSSANDLILKDANGTIFRGIRANAWLDNINTRFFQVGAQSDNVLFTCQEATNIVRLGFSSNVTQFSNQLFSSILAPLGIFEISGATRFFNIYNNGNTGIGTTTDAGFKLDVNGTARVSGNLTLEGNISKSSPLSITAPSLIELQSNVRVTNSFTIQNHIFTDGTRTLIGSTVIQNTSAILEVLSTTMGFLSPRMTTTQINAIVNPANGLQCYNTTLNTICFYNGTSWQRVTSTGM